jgi:hypothetical protein
MQRVDTDRQWMGQDNGDSDAGEQASCRQWSCMKIVPSDSQVLPHSCRIQSRHLKRDDNVWTLTRPSGELPQCYLSEVVGIPNVIPKKEVEGWTIG